MSDTPSNNDAPLDDYGVHNDHVLDICESLITQLWKRLVTESHQMSIAEIKDAAITIDSLWNLVQSIIEINEDLKNEDKGPPGPSLPENDPPSA